MKRKLSGVVASAIVACGLLGSQVQKADALTEEVNFLLMWRTLWMNFIGADCDYDEKGGGSYGVLKCDPYYHTRGDGLGAVYESNGFIIAPAIPLTNNLTVGLYAGLSGSEFDWSKFGNTQIDSDSTFIGGFFGWAPLPDTVLTGFVLHSEDEHDLSGFGDTANFDGSTTVGGLQIQHTLNFDHFFVRPSVHAAIGHSEADSFTDSGGFFTPSTEVDTTLIGVGVAVGAPIPCSHWPFAQFTSRSDTDSCGEVTASLKASHNSVDGYRTDDATVPDPDMSYFSHNASLGINAPLTDHLDFGAKVSHLGGGDIDAFNFQTYINVDLWGMMGNGPVFAD